MKTKTTRTTWACSLLLTIMISGGGVAQTDNTKSASATSSSCAVYYAQDGHASNMVQSFVNNITKSGGDKLAQTLLPNVNATYSEDGINFTIKNQLSFNIHTTPNLVTGQYDSTSAKFIADQITIKKENIKDFNNLKIFTFAAVGDHNSCAGTGQNKSFSDLTPGCIKNGSAALTGKIQNAGEQYGCALIITLSASTGN